MTDLAKKAKAQQWSSVPASSLTSNLVKNAKKIMLLANEDDDTPFSILTIPYDPGSGNLSPFINSSAFNSGVSPRASPLVNSLNYLLKNSTGNIDPWEEPESIVSARATGAASSQLVAAVSGKKYKIFALSIDVSGTAATGQVSINETTSGLVLLGSDIGAAGTAGNSITIPPGVLQPTANNALQVTSVANATVNATLVYGPAR